ncbi:MarR family winged helix-turn-helix transcriptional regulator [Paenibacillus endoradicis]|uniref:MarR family winged helix-turn-helix transcriptional regulator n=1 Tax=Paenibacillus endoradicis TaxID=2972487 RepID=UPI002158A951|nr:MarR family transcriptional regulator [Paenibacillus endoradicis]MCR8656440.1 MarR family transcriptional regulator [Paenibacillus endoradicis]
MRGLGNRTVLYQQVVSTNLELYNNDYISIDILREKGPITAGELSKLTGLTTGSVTALIDRLEKHDYVRRENDPNDRRKVIIVPQYEEKEEVSNAYYPLHEAMIALGSKYTAGELELISKFLEEAGNVIEEQTGHLTAKPRVKK